MDLTNEELRLNNEINFAKNKQDLNYIINKKTKVKFNSDTARSFNYLQVTFAYRPKIKDIYEETLNKISNKNIRDLIREYISLENRTRSAIEDYNDYKIQFTRPFLIKHGLFNTENIFNDEPYVFPSSVKFINSDKLIAHYGSIELDGILVQLRLHLGYVIQNFQRLKEFNQELILELDNETEEE